MISDVLALLVRLLIILAFLRIAVALLPRWLLALVIFLIVLTSGILDPRLVRRAVGASAGLIEVLIPFLVILGAFWVITSSGFGGRKR